MSGANLVTIALAAGISIVAREAKVSRSVVKAFVNRGTVLQRSTLRRSKRRWSGSAS